MISITCFATFLKTTTFQTIYQTSGYLMHVCRLKTRHLRYFIQKLICDIYYFHHIKHFEKIYLPYSFIHCRTRIVNYSFGQFWQTNQCLLISFGYDLTIQFWIPLLLLESIQNYPIGTGFILNTTTMKKFCLLWNSNFKLELLKLVT